MPQKDAIIPEMTPIRILIADDHEIFRRGLRSLLESHPEWEVCGEAIDGQEAVDRTKELNPDIVVLDITMPRLNGLEAAQLIRSEAPHSKMVILSQHEPALMRQAALSAGASAYVTKSEVSRELMMAIETLLLSPGAVASEETAGNL
jgi:two-component system nitrate/nitrite response regulator NarL